MENLHLFKIHDFFSCYRYHVPTSNQKGMFNYTSEKTPKHVVKFFYDELHEYNNLKLDPKYDVWIKPGVGAFMGNYYGDKELIKKGDYDEIHNTCPTIENFIKLGRDIVFSMPKVI